MDSLFVLRQRFQELYAKKSKIIDKIIQFIVALVTFYFINKNVGFMKVASTSVVTLALAVICTFFPMIMTIIAASILILVHMYTVSLAALGVTALVFFVMYIFYFRLSPGMALALLLTPIAFVLKVPCVVPIAYALITGPSAIIAISCGSIVYYMIEYVKKAAVGMKGSDAAGLMGQVSAYVKAVFQSKEMWIVIAAVIISFLVVYTIRKQAVNHAWKLAVILGAVVYIVVITAGDMVFGIDASFQSMIIGGIAAVLVGLVLELFFFSLDYAKSEKFQYEDDEYYYYVKAIPKISVATPEKTVKKINEHRETEIMDASEVHRRSRKQGDGNDKHPAGKRQGIDEVDKMLLTQSLKKDLHLK